MNGDLTQYLMSNARVAETWSSFSRMKSKETVLDAINQFQTIGKILVVSCGVRHLHLIHETFVPNSKDRKIDFTGAINSFRLSLQQPTSHNLSLAQPGKSYGFQSNISSVHIETFPECGYIMCPSIVGCADDEAIQLLSSY